MKFYSLALVLPAFLLDGFFPAVAIPPGKPDANPWEKIRTPSTSGHNEAVGFYSAGCLNRAVKIPNDGEGFHMMRLSRNRYWAHQTLQDFYFSFARTVKMNTGDNLLGGDTAQPRGGPFTTGHASHQIGLDADIWFLQASEAGFKTAPTNSQREAKSARSLLNPRGFKYPEHFNPAGVPDLDTAFWSDKKVEMLKAAAVHPDVERIFVHPYIKKALCQQFGGMSLPDSVWLRKLRPWWGHDAHFHVRLKCPPDSPDCRVQETVPVGDGCTDDLGWWFTKDAQDAWKKIQEDSRDSVFKLPKLPERCAQLLK